VFGEEGRCFGTLRVDGLLQPLVVGPPETTRGEPASSTRANAPRRISVRPPTPRAREEIALPLPVARLSRPRFFQREVHHIAALLSRLLRHRQPLVERDLAHGEDSVVVGRSRRRSRRNDSRRGTVGHRGSVHRNEAAEVVLVAFLRAHK
jgi:hypothetical protein